MNKIKLIILVTIFFTLILYTNKKNASNNSPIKNRFTLITILYNETNPERIAEYITCLKKNCEHQLIDNIHVIYDTAKDNLSNENPIYEYITSHKISISVVKGRPSYNHCFEIAHKFYPNQFIILANADIYFNETLMLLSTYDFTNKFIALTRWDILNNGQLKIAHCISYDSWIFKTPLCPINAEYIKIGTNECDHLIAYEAQKAGLHVINPCFSVYSTHLHLSWVRNYEINKHRQLPIDCRPIPRDRL